jgi:hypothetical protein
MATGGGPHAGGAPRRRLRTAGAPVTPQAEVAPSSVSGCDCCCASASATPTERVRFARTIDRHCRERSHSHAPDLGAGLFEGRPRPQYSAYRFVASSLRRRCRRDRSHCYFGVSGWSIWTSSASSSNRTEDMLRISTRLGFRVGPDVAVNRTSAEFGDERAALKANDRAMAKLRELLADDVAVYERAYKRRM